MAPVIALVLAVIAAILALRRRRPSVETPARTVILSPRKSTLISDNGAVRSVQSAEITIGSEDLDRLWNPTNLERLARTYWLFLSHVTLGLIRVVYGAGERSVVLIARPLTLLRFDAPQYVLEPDHGNVRWTIRGGLLVARAGRGAGFLSLDVRRDPPRDDGQTKVRIEVEVANFTASIATGLGMPVYMVTQSAIHVMVTHAFLRSLSTLDLAVSKVGRFETPEAAQAPAVGP